MRTSDFDYDLPPEFIAQTPVEPRHAARLMVLDRQSGRIEHSIFSEIGRYLHAGDLMVLNETRVIPARLFARKLPGGGKAEILLLHKLDDLTWEALVGGKGLAPGRQLELQGGLLAQVIAAPGGSRRWVRFAEPLEPRLAAVGNVPLPPYIHTALQDAERYQTVFARHPGSAAAPTAGLHFTPALIERLASRAVGFAYLTLHVGLDTFAPVTKADPAEHAIHTEWCQISPEAAWAVNLTRAQEGRVIAVGTTSVRSLETAARKAPPGETIAAFEGPTDLFILPGYTFRAVDALVTNFHLPRSTLIMLVSAFAGRQRILEAYAVAMQEGYRFYSFGDAMLII